MNTTKTLEEPQKDSRDDIVAHAYKTGFIAALDACREKLEETDIFLAIHAEAIDSLKDPQR